MIIDAREIEERELFLKVREVLSSCSGGVDIEVLLLTYKESVRLKTFAAMSGCQTRIEKKDGYFLAHITGNVCCV